MFSSRNGSRLAALAIGLALVCGMAWRGFSASAASYKTVYIPLVSMPAHAEHPPVPVQYCAEGLGQLYLQSNGVCGNVAAAASLEEAAKLNKSDVQRGVFGPAYGIILQISDVYAGQIGFPNGGALYPKTDGVSGQLPADGGKINNTPVQLDIISGLWGLGPWSQPQATPTPTAPGEPTVTATAVPTSTLTPTTTPIPANFCSTVGLLEVPGWNNRSICGDAALVALAQGLLPMQTRAGTFVVYIDDDTDYPIEGGMFYGDSPGVTERSGIIPLNVATTVTLTSSGGGVLPVWKLQPVDVCPDNIAQEQIGQAPSMSVGVCGDERFRAANTRPNTGFGQLTIESDVEEMAIWLNPDFAGRPDGLPGNPFTGGACFYKVNAPDSAFVPTRWDVATVVTLTKGTWGISSDLTCKP